MITIGIVGGMVTFFFQGKKSIEPSVTLSFSHEPFLENFFRHPLSGEKLEASRENPFVFAVMVENSAEAWPLSGLEKAFLVIEAPVEAGIPRFIAFYSEETEVEKIGPVRSARLYYLDWAGEFGALYAHVGGSPEALQEIRSRNLFDLNEFYHAPIFWRSSDRYAPHNTYTSSSLLNDFLLTQQKQDIVSESVYELWNFKEDEPVVRTPESPLEIQTRFSFSDLYDVSWHYESKTNKYRRFQAGKEAGILAHETSLLANNVVFLMTDIRSIDEVGRKAIRTLGEGDAIILQDGKMIEGYWNKSSADARLRFYDDKNNEIKWNAGKTWIEIVSSQEDLSILFEEEDSTSE